MKAARLPISLAIGAVAVATMYALSESAFDAGRESLSGSLWWQGQLLLDYALRNAGSPDDPVGGFAKIASFPLGFAVYSAAAYGLLSCFGRES